MESLEVEWNRWNQDGTCWNNYSFVGSAGVWEARGDQALLVEKLLV